MTETSSVGVNRAIPPIRHLRQQELAQRWNLSARTLERWRWRGQGPAYMKLGGSVAYDMADVLAYEAQHRRVAQAQHDGKLDGPDRFARGIPG